MSVLGLELSDAGIMVAGGDPPRLLHVDGRDTESPGFAIPHGNRLLVGMAAQKRAHLNPVQVNTRFWDQLNTKRLKSPTPGAGNHAEVAFAHLSSIWQKVRRHGDQLVMAVPAFVGRYQMGLIVSICEELTIPLKGIFALPVAAAQQPCPNRLLMHMDIHLHRLEVTLLDQGDLLTQSDSATAPDRGFLYLYRKWVESIGVEFVRTTRFDPLHRASSEQELYDRLPQVLSAMQHQVSIQFSMTSAGKRYTVDLSKDRFMNGSEEVFWEMRRLIAGIRARHGTHGKPLTVQLTHRVRRLPGWELMVGNAGEDQIIELEPGCGGFGALTLWEGISEGKTQEEISFITSRPWRTAGKTLPRTDQPRKAPRPAAPGDSLPTHLLYRHRAYPITDKPLVVGRGDSTLGISLPIRGDMAGISKRHCSIRLQGDHVLLTDHSTYGTFVDDAPVGGTVALKLGQVIRLGTPGEKLELIAIESDET